MFDRPFLGIFFGIGICIWLLGSAPALAMDCPVSGFDQVGERVTEAPSCDAAMQLLMACQMGSSADVAISVIVIKKCEGDFLASLSAGARRGYERKVGACGKDFANEGGTLFQSIRAICAAQVAHTYARRATHRSSRRRKPAVTG
ncbi:MAG: hypothetical protein WA776_19685 [Xanthobacteraceae bacterium]|jgi:hypothetical protein